MPAASDLPVGGPVDRGPTATLAQILEYLESPVLEVLAAPAGLQVPTGGTVVLGVGEPVPETPRGLLLAVGGGASAATATLVREAAQAGYAAVVVKASGGDLASLVDTAEDAGIALLRTPDEMAWRHLDALLNAASPGVVPPVDVFGSVGVGDLFALANAVAGTVGGATTIEDPQGQVLAYSNLPEQEIDEIRREAILGRQTPDRPTNRAEYQAVFRTNGVLRIRSPGAGSYERIARALWAGQRPLGIVWAISDHPPLGPDAEERLADAARVVELHLIRLQGRRDPDRWRRSESLRAALDSAPEGNPGRTDLGLEPDDGCVVLAIAPDLEQDRAGHAASVPARIVDLVTLLCEGWDSRALCVDLGGTVYAMLPMGTTGATERVARFARDVIATARRSAALQVSVGIGALASGPDGVALSRRWADRVLRTLRERGEGGGAASLDEVHPAAALLAMADQGAVSDEMLIPLVRALVEGEATGGVPFGQTVLAFLGTMGDYARTARLLSLHENTVRYRVRRAQELHGLDLSDPDAVLVTWLQLRLALGRIPDPPPGASA